MLCKAVKSIVKIQVSQKGARKHVHYAKIALHKTGDFGVDNAAVVSAVFADSLMESHLWLIKDPNDYFNLDLALQLRDSFKEHVLADPRRLAPPSTLRIATHSTGLSGTLTEDSSQAQRQGGALGGGAARAGFSPGIVPGTPVSHRAAARTSSTGIALSSPVPRGMSGTSTPRDRHTALGAGAASGSARPPPIAAPASSRDRLCRSWSTGHSPSKHIEIQLRNALVHSVAAFMLSPSSTQGKG